MLNLTLDPASVDSTIAYVEQVKQKILQGMRQGMMDAMEGLAGNVAEKLQGDPIESRSGNLLDAVLGSPRVTETEGLIRGTVSASVGKLHLGIWLEEGIHVPAVKGTLLVFTTADGDTVYSRGHRAFDVKPHPFMNPSLQEYKAQIMEMIAEAVTEAIDE